MLVSRCRAVALIILVCAVACGRLVTLSSHETNAGDATDSSTSTLPLAMNQTPGRDPNIHAWADAATDALWFNDYTNATGYLSDGWGFAQAFDMVTDSVRRTAGSSHLDKLIQLVERYDSISYSPFTPTYYDDHAWMALALVRAALALEQSPALAAEANLAWAGAQKEYAVIKQGFDPTTHRIFWTSNRSNWVCASTATTAMVACALYEGAGQNPCDLSFAKELYDSWRQVIFDSNTGIVNDGIDQGTNQVGTGQYTYNYGTLKGAALCLHRHTGISAYLDDARSMAAHELKVMAQQAGNDLVYTEPGCVSSACTGDGALFKGIGMRYFATLSRLDPGNLNVLAAVNGSAHATWTLGRSGTQLSSVWQHAPFSGDGQAAQTSAAMGLAAVAEGVITSPQNRAAGLFYEAENQNLLGLMRVANSPGTTGLGCVDSAATDATGIVFEVITPLAGPHRLSFRLASAQAGVRTVQVGSATATLSFPSTAGLTQFATATADIALKAGLNRVALLYSTAQGSRAEAYIDSLSVHPLASTTSQSAPPTGPAPLTPINGAGVSIQASFAWQPVGGAQSYQLIVDDVMMMNVAGTKTTATLDANTLNDGPHRWYVLASDGQQSTAGTQASFVFCGAEPSLPQSFTLADSSMGLVVSWTPQANRACITTDVSYAGALRCAALNTNSCLIANLHKADVQTPLSARFFNAAHQLGVLVAADGTMQATNL